MNRSEAGKLGAEAHKKVARKYALDRYYKGPSICKNCGKIIEVKESEQPSAVRKKQFCDHSCAASYNNKNSQSRRVTGYGECARCGKRVYHSRQKNGGYSRRKYCDHCLTEVKSEQLQRRSGKEIVNIRDLTFGELQKRYGSKSGQSLRSVIVRDSRKAYKESGLKLECLICKYTRHVNVCHIKPWTKFDDNIKLREINHISNLVALCPNHHWEFDHNLLDEKDKAALALK